MWIFRSERGSAGGGGMNAVDCGDDYVENCKGRVGGEE